MRTCVPWLGVLSLLAVSASARAQMKDAVELLPAHTLACVELRHPERLSREVAALIKGSALGDLPRRMARVRGAGNQRIDWRLREQLTMLNVFLCPEAIDEAGRSRGAFVALTGFAKDNTPEVVGVLQTGSSNIPGMVMHAFMGSWETHIVGEVEGVALYRERSRIYGVRPKAAPGGPPQMEEREHGPVVAHLPGMVLFGSSVDSLKEVIRRAKGKSTDPSLASLRAYKESAALRERPGLFAYVDMTALEAQLDEQTRRPGHPLGRGWTALKTILGKEAVRNLTASLTLHNGTLECQVRANLHGKSDSPLFGLLPDKAAQPELLHFAPNDALLTMAGGFGDGEKRWKTFVTLLDALDKVEGRGEANRTSKVLQEMQEKVKLRIDKDVLARITGAALVSEPITRGDRPPQSLLILRAVDADAARALEEKDLPKLFGLVGGEVPLPSEEKVKGQAIRTVADALPDRQAIHYGRQGSFVVLGLDKQRVAASLTAGSKKEGILGEAKVAAAIKDIDASTVVVGILSSATTVTEGYTLLEELSARNRMKMPRPGLPPPPVEKKPEKSTAVSKELLELRKAVEPLPPLVFSLSRQPDSLVLEMRQPGLRRSVPRLLDVWIDSILRGIEYGGGGVRMEAGGAPAK